MNVKRLQILRVDNVNLENENRKIGENNTMNNKEIFLEREVLQLKAERDMFKD